MRPTLLLPGQTAPSFQLLNQQSYSMPLAQLLGANGAVLVFFSTENWPGDLKLLNAYAQHYPTFQQAGISVAAISALNWETLYHLHARLQLPYPLLFDPCARVSKTYGSMLIPKFVTGRAVYGLDAAGHIVYRHAGFTDPSLVLAAYQNARE